MSAVSNVRPGKRKREMAQAAAMPKIKFVTTAIGATVIVRRIAASVSSSAVRVRQYAPKPRPNASTKTSTSGITIRTPTTPSAAGHERRVEGREDDPGDGLETRRAEAGGCLLDVRVDALEHGLEGAHDEGEADEHEHEDDREARVGGLDAERDEETPEPSRLDVEARVDEPGDRRRQRERQVDERVDHALHRELVADEDPGDEKTDDDVDRRRDERGADGELIGRDGAIGRDGGPEAVERQRRCL